MTQRGPALRGAGAASAVADPPRGDGRARRTTPGYPAGTRARRAAARSRRAAAAKSRWAPTQGAPRIVTAGFGRAQREGGAIEDIRPGDVVWFEPGKKHWHGASAEMTHIAIAEAQDGKVVDWLEQVTDAEYGGE